MTISGQPLKQSIINFGVENMQMKKILAIFMAVCFLVSLSAVAVSAKADDGNKIKNNEEEHKKKHDK